MQPEGCLDCSVRPTRGMTLTMPGLESALAEQLERRRRAAAEAWSLRDEVILIGFGKRISIPGRGDRTYPFRAHSEYLYLTDREGPGGILAFDPLTGWMDFVAPTTREERLWEGGSPTDLEEASVDAFGSWLAARQGRKTACLGDGLDEIVSDPILETFVREALNEIRRRKDEVGLARMRQAELVTCVGFAAVRSSIQPGRTERELQIELEAEFYRQGADFLAFDTIVGGGPNSAVLHFPPSTRRFQEGDLVLIDAGAEIRGYASDITRTYPASGTFNPEQAELHAIVREANRVATLSCRPGTEWRDVHRAASLVLAEGLVSFGLLFGEPESLVDSGAVHIFFPHGIGHMVGLGIRDAGGLLPGRVSNANEFPRLRVDLPLLPGYTMTIEPGFYVVPALLGDQDFRERHRRDVNWDRAARMVSFGGIRIEDNVLVTTDGCEVLTSNVPLID